MSILIKGADISPDHIQSITVFPEGFAIVEEYEMGLQTEATKCEVASVPTPHGRLIDADALCKDRVSNDNVVIYAKCAPTVIEAEE